MIALISAILAILSLAGVLLEFYYMKQHKNYYDKQVANIKSMIHRMYFELTVQKMTESESLKSVEDMARIGKKLFGLLKKRYKLEGVSTFAEMKEKVKEMDIPDDEKRIVTGFLDDMIYVEYAPKNERYPSISKERKEMIRDNIIKLFKMVGQSQQSLKPK